ncbi:impaired sucrose induction 1 [Micractinium conductrix]|uniref:Impaired sucrose induction 1 n=1 Tax=Micractinium conductrix TaxID=554055 RepID=A0A2P6VGV7_9CHLO|nr:impaired sucrose induction 1 [Micractinium conductrix]|eukprot:PSC73321.1 impaired sucrose induction 1 [Micractinium conductrix]
MELLGLPPPLQDVLDGLQRDVVGVEIASRIKSQLQQAQSPLSLVRQDAYASLAAALDSYLRDPAAAGAVLPALARVWPELLASIALGLRQAPPAGGAAGGAGGGAAGTLGGASGPLAYRAVGPGELTAMIRVLELACLLAAHARQSSLGAGVLPALVAQLPAAPPGLACAALDALLALQLRHPAAFVAFSDLGGVQQVCTLLRDHSTPEPVRSRAVQFLNLLLVQLVPELLPRDALPPPSPAPASPAPLLGPPSPPPGGRHSPPPAASPEAAAAVLAALAGAKAAVADSLGREVLAMLQRRILLGDASAEAKLGQLSAALTLFIESEGA